MIKADPQDTVAPSFCSRGPPDNAHLAKHVFVVVLNVTLKPI